MINDEGAAVAAAQKHIDLVITLDMPAHARTAGTVAHHCMVALASNVFRATAMIADH